VVDFNVPVDFKISFINGVNRISPTLTSKKTGIWWRILGEFMLEKVHY